MDLDEIYSDNDYSDYSDNRYESSFIADSELDDGAFYFDDLDDTRHFNSGNMEEEQEQEQEIQEIIEEFRKPHIKNVSCNNIE